MTLLRLTSKKWLSTVVLGLCFLLAAVPALGQNRAYSDVPDWAYQAVKKLVDNGYLELYEDGTFRGGNPVDRYTFAMVVAKLLTNFGEGVTRAGQDDVALLRKLSNEFQNELVLLTLKNKELEARLVQIEQGRLILAEDQTKNTAGMQALSNELKALRNQVAQILAEKNQLEARLSTLETQQEEHQVELENLRAELEKERRTNRMLLIVLGLIGAAGIFLPAQ
ncbi:MAG TPA: hypothetical protein GXX33_04885 [Firmicutes bacterium]|uniref:S-layer homology domain-containing protein n=1 Tax=Capillibacterium thermochitinicola TaxID=2699427 RepID=A0A8J6I182_9FIRM|nr:S-layer homology domain-containing protein [Capillibacterium thermochitinicola]MBA2132819.1 S-layer homology domain-containing protein [Capillibacterium thermochitinicola]HHW12320.1 hypothetical protein [Bacillota bacterium]